jgi:hypothetical protein
MSPAIRQLMTFPIIYNDILLADSMSCKLSAIILLAMFCFPHITLVLLKYVNCHSELISVTYSKSFI